MINEGLKTYRAGEDLEKYRRVKIEAGTTTTPPEVVYADAGEKSIGVTEDSADDEDPVTIRLWCYGGTMPIEAASAATVGDEAYGAADGKVDDTVVGDPIGFFNKTVEAAEWAEIIPVAPGNINFEPDAKTEFTLVKSFDSSTVAVVSSAPFAFKVVDMIVHCEETNSSGTVKLNDAAAGGGNDLTSTVVCDTNHEVSGLLNADGAGAPATMDDAQVEIPAAGALSLVPASSAKGTAYIRCVRS